MKTLTIPVVLYLPLFLIVGLSAAQVRGADAAPATAPATQPQGHLPDLDKWTLRPSLASANPLQYKLLPDAVDQTPGNAVPLYLMASQSGPDQKTTDEVLLPENHRFDYSATPIDQFPEQYARRLLDAYSNRLAFVDKGARRDNATWDDDGPDFELAPEVFWYRDGLRHSALLLSFRARYQVSKRDWGAASYTLQTSLGLARHFGVSPLLVHARDEEQFAAIALSGGVKEWIQRGDSPNLYWALSNLPRPFVEVGPVARSERIPVGQTPLARALRDELPKDRWAEVVREMVGRLQDLRPPYKRNPAEIETQARRTIASAYPRARQYLLSAGVARKTIEAMSEDEAVGTYFVKETRAASDELWKCWGLPYPQAQEQMLRSWRDLKPDQPPLVEDPLFQADMVTCWSAPLPDYDIPFLMRERFLLSEPDRRIAIYQTVEALRDYAARHDGRPPERLDQVTDLPVPPDPITGKPFDYSAQGQTARIDALTPWYWRTGWRLELTFTK